MKVLLERIDELPQKKRIQDIIKKHEQKEIFDKKAKELVYFFHQTMKDFYFYIRLTLILKNPKTFWRILTLLIKI